MDQSWWKMYADDVQRIFKGERFSNNVQDVRYRVKQMPDIDGFANSGAALIAMLIKNKVNRVILLGYDCQKTDGKAHWHGDHPKGLGNAKGMDKWHDRFAKLIKLEGETKIINASRATALDMFERMDLENALT